MSIQQYVQRGIARLNSYYGNTDWQHKCEKIDIRSFNNCVLGRLFGEFMVGCRKLGIPSERALEYGFDVQHGFDEEFAELQATWEDALANPPLGTEE